MASHAGFGAFYRGLAATAAREAGWTFGFLGLAPLVKHALREDSKFFNRNDVAASLAASVLAGQAAALLTQPADTIKALLQADLAHVCYTHPLSVCMCPCAHGLALYLSRLETMLVLSTGHGGRRDRCRWGRRRRAGNTGGASLQQHLGRRATLIPTASGVRACLWGSRVPPAAALAHTRTPTKHLLVSSLARSLVLSLACPF